jgi:type 2 lantibiotic biosynthesis protein LanM
VQFSLHGFARLSFLPVENKVTDRHFGGSLGCLVSPVMAELATQLASLDGLTRPERDAIAEAASESLFNLLNDKLSRLLVLELNAARVTGRLKGNTPELRWQEFLALSSKQSFWCEIAAHYPSLLSRISTILRNRCGSALAFARRWVADRAQLASLCGSDPGSLHKVNFGEGDSHGGGSSVAILRGRDWKLVYKPRSLSIDIALRNFVAKLADDHGGPWSIAVPTVKDYGDYGWVEFVNHRYAETKEELTNFYCGVGFWLAIMRLLGGSDLHAENVIAQGGSAIVVDCETLFTPQIPPVASGNGAAFDRANELLSGTVLRVGLLPRRGMGLGWRGVDGSALGMLAEQQPVQLQQGIIDAGLDHAYMGPIPAEPTRLKNHPTVEPTLEEYWPEVLRGFEDLTATLQGLDDAQLLRSRLQAFEGCRLRVVPRATEVYNEVGRMLWHPASLHNDAVARQRAFQLLERMGTKIALAPSDPAVINAELDELLESDVPYFSAIASEGRLSGPRGTHWLNPCNLVNAAFENWRSADFGLERHVIETSLVSAYINEGWKAARVSFFSKNGRGGDLDVRRRRQVAQIVGRIMRNAVHGDDGTVTWVAPALTASGWSVQPLQPDLYNGISGIALLLGACLREIAAGRADPIDGIDSLFAATLQTLRLVEDKRARERDEGPKTRPPAPGCYIGLGSQIWTYLILAHWELDAGDGLQRACKLTEEIPRAAAANDTNDVLSGTAGAIVPLLMLGRKTGSERFVQLASQLGDLLHERAKVQNGHVYWVHKRWPEGIGGFAHGVTGIGWALTLLARANKSSRHEQLAQKAFAFEDALFDEEEQNWLDLRMPDDARTAAAWCHGAVGIGLARLNLDPILNQEATRRFLNLAADATWRMGLGWNHCACHGDLGAWELLNHAIAAGEAPNELSASYLLDIILTSLEKHGPCCMMGGKAFAPGLLPGVGGVAYQLLRAHPESDLPSILAPGGFGL